MTILETGIIMDILTTAYPRFYAGKDAPDPHKAIALWAEMFADDDVRIVAAAVKALIACDEKGFPPHIGAVKARMRQITELQEQTEIEAWAIVSKAVRRTDWKNPEVQFGRLPEDVRSVLRTPHTLIEWGKVDEDTLATVIASNFQRSYRARRTAVREFNALPSEVKKLVGTLATGLALEDGNA